MPKKSTKTMTRKEVILELSKRLRDPALDDKTFLKLIRAYGALQEWEGFEQ